MPQVNPWHLLFAISPHVKCSVKNNWNAFMCWQVISTSYCHTESLKLKYSVFQFIQQMKLPHIKWDAIFGNTMFYDFDTNLLSVFLRFATNSWKTFSVYVYFDHHQSTSYWLKWDILYSLLQVLQHKDYPPQHRGTCTGSLLPYKPL